MFRPMAEYKKTLCPERSRMREKDEYCIGPDCPAMRYPEGFPRHPDTNEMFWWCGYFPKPENYPVKPDHR